MNNENGSLVGIVMGSDSDLPVMQEAMRVLEQFGIPYESAVVSAHRTPERLQEYGTGAQKKGLRVIIAGAGGAAHLPGMLASYTTLPVIGVPVRSKTMDGLDSLLSIAQMPPGVPVATVAVNGATNAGILAAEILGLQRPALQEQIAAYKAAMASEVAAKSAELQDKGYKRYLEDHEA